MVSCKAVGIALKLTAEGDNQLGHPQTYAFLAVVVAAVVTQVRCAACAVAGGGPGHCVCRAAGSVKEQQGRGKHHCPHPLPTHYLMLHPPTHHPPYTTHRTTTAHTAHPPLHR